MDVEVVIDVGMCVHAYATCIFILDIVTFFN